MIQYIEGKMLRDMFVSGANNLQNHKDLVDKLHSLGKKALYIPDFNECANYVKAHVEKNDIVLTLGAGTVTNIGPMLVD